MLWIKSFKGKLFIGKIFFKKLVSTSISTHKSIVLDNVWTENGVIDVVYNRHSLSKLKNLLSTRISMKTRGIDKLLYIKLVIGTLLHRIGCYRTAIFKKHLSWQAALLRKFYRSFHKSIDRDFFQKTCYR